MGFSFVEAFILPHIAATSPAFVDGWFGMLVGSATKADMGALPMLWLLTNCEHLLGGRRFAGIATFRARILPRWAGVLLAAGTVLAPTAAALPT